MPLTLAQMLALLPDNTAGDISAADARNVVTAIVRGQRAPYSVDHADDVWWESNIGDFTTVTITGTQTVTEKDGYVAVEYSGQSAADYNGLFKARSFSVGDSFAVRVTAVGPASQFSIPGLAFTDGVVGGSNVIQTTAYATNSDVATIAVLHGTLTNVDTSAWSNAGKSAHPWLDGIIIRLTYAASNSFQGEVSIDGTHWTSFGNGATAKTMTPTHVGLTWSKEGGANESLVSFGPLCRLA